MSAHSSPTSHTTKQYSIMPHELIGTVKVINDEQVFASGFNKKEFVVTDGADKYPQDIKFEAVKDNVEKVNAINVGDQVKVTFDIKGNEYNGKYYVNLVAWKIDTLKASGAAPVADDPLDEDIPMDDDDSGEPPF
jgi:single-strand DNA-binding protein